MFLRNMILFLIEVDLNDIQQTVNEDSFFSISLETLFPIFFMYAILIALIFISLITCDDEHFFKICLQYTEMCYLRKYLFIYSTHFLGLLDFVLLRFVIAL